MNQNPQQNNSVLDQIIATSQQATQQVISAQNPLGNQENGGNLNPNNEPPKQKKPRDPMTLGTILKLMGTLLLVCLIFMGMFLAYIVFNPQEAGFFQTVFNISRNDVTKVLATMIHTSFGILSFIVAIVFVVVGFRMFWTPKEQKRKKLLMGIWTIFSGILFFSILTFWAFLFQHLQAANFLNPDGDILIFDNDLYIHEETRSISEIYNTNSLIGPISLRYDISDNAKRVQKQRGIQLDSYSIDFDGANCNNGTSKFEGVNPTTATEIICTFDQLRTYQPKGSYTVTDYEGNVNNINMNLSPIQIQGIIQIEEKENQNGKRMRAYDASSLRHLGEVVWMYDSDASKKIRENYLSIAPTAEKVILHFYLDNKTNNPVHFRTFIVQDGINKKNDGNITMTQNVSNPQEYIFKIENLQENPDEILSVQWKLNNSNSMCFNEKSNSCAHTFTTYGQFSVEATVNFLGNRSKTISQTFQIDPPLIIERHVKVSDTNGKNLNPESTFDAKNNTYVIKDIIPPQKIFLDARDVITTNPGYNLQSVSWNISDGKTTETRTGERIEFDVNKTTRYNIVAEYTFEKNIKTGRNDDTRKVSEKILLDLERKNLSAHLKVQSSSDYVPARVVVDASQSHSEYGEIIKFVYDFGEGRPKAEGDAIQTYQYTTAGEKTITVTVIDANGEQASAKQILVLKETPKTLNFSTSRSPGTINMPVDFTAEGTTGQIEDYLWNFNDNTPISHGYEVSHTFKKAGTYNVTLTVRYLDGTEKTISQPFIVVNSLE